MVVIVVVVVVVVIVVVVVVVFVKITKPNLFHGLVQNRQRFRPQLRVLRPSSRQLVHAVSEARYSGDLHRAPRREFDSR